MVFSLRRLRRFSALFGAIALTISLAGCRSDDEKVQGFMTRATEYSEAGQYNEAIIEFKNALQIDPNIAGAHEGLAKAYLQSNQIMEGFWELSETVRLDPDNIDARLTYATLSLAAKRNEDALEQAEAVIALDPENAPAHLLLGQIYLNLGRLDEVAAPLERAIELQPDDASYRAVLASYYSSYDRPEDAEKQLLEGVRRDPRPLLWTMLGRLYFDQSRFDESQAAFQNALTLATEEAAAAGSEQTEPADLAQAYQNLASFHFQRDDADAGVAILEEGIEKSRNRGELIGLLARYYRSQGDDEKATELIEKSTEIDPTDPDPFLTVSNLRGQAGNLEGALAAAEQAIAADPTYAKARLRKAELLIDMGARSDDQAKVDEGRAIVDEVLAGDPTNPDGLFVLAKVEIAAKNLDAGLTALRSAIDARPNWPQAHFVLGSALLLSDDAQRARAELARAVELDPGLLDARRLLAQVHAQLGEHEYAIEQGNRYLEVRPTDDRTRITVAQSMVRLGKLDEAIELIEVIPEDRQTVDVLFALGRLQAAKGDAPAARATMLKADALRPHNAKILSVLLDLDRSEGKIGNSVKRVNDAVAANPEDAELWELKGLVAMSTGDITAAEKAFEKSIELDPGSLSSYQQLARIYAGTGRTKETITLYEQAVETQPDNAGANHFLGVLYEMNGQTEKAKRQYELALAADDSLGESKNNLAYLMAESGTDLDRALKLAQEAKASMPDSANAADTLGWVLYKRGVASAAVGYLREAVQVANPEDPAIGEIRTHLSLAYEATGEIDKAIASLEAALVDLERLKKAGRLRNDPPWAARARSEIERLKAAG